MIREKGPSPKRSRLAALRLLLFVALVGFVGAATAVGPGRALGWVVDNIISAVVVGGAIFVVFGLAALALVRLYGKHRHHL